MAKILNEQELHERVAHCSACLNKKFKLKDGTRAIVICGGTGCLSADSGAILDEFKKLIKENGLEETVTANNKTANAPTAIPAISNLFFIG